MNTNQRYLPKPSWEGAFTYIGAVGAWDIFLRNNRMYVGMDSAASSGPFIQDHKGQRSATNRHKFPEEVFEFVTLHLKLNS